MKTTGKAFWAYTTALDTKFEPCWRVDLHVTKEESEKLKALGLKGTLLDVEDTYKYSYKFKRNEKRKKPDKNGSLDNTAPSAVNADGTPFEGIIGNGSLADVQFNVYAWEFKGRKGCSADFNAIKVLKEEAYVPAKIEEAVNPGADTEAKDEF
jgi:hypothetical protein